MIPTLPPSFDVDILKKTNEANIALAELKGLICLLPNYKLSLQPLTAREAVASSEIENIRITTIEILQAEIIQDTREISQFQKETINYKKALNQGFNDILHLQFLATNGIVNIQSILEPNKPGVRTQMGTVIADDQGNVICTPPQLESEIRDLMENLDAYANNQHDDVDPLIKMAIYHYQYESIHPFYDGNGRTGRILMVLYLCLMGRLQFPILYLSGYILSHKSQYYKYLQNVRDHEDWKTWILFILEGVALQSKETAGKVTSIIELQRTWKSRLKKDYSKMYSIEMLEYLFSNAFYTQSRMTQYTSISRPTSIKYLEKFASQGLMKEQKIGRDRLFFIPEFIEILS